MLVTFNHFTREKWGIEQRKAEHQQDTQYKAKYMLKKKEKKSVVEIDCYRTLPVATPGSNIIRGPKTVYWIWIILSIAKFYRNLKH